MNVRESANLAKITYDAMRRKCKKNIGKTIYVEHLGNINISKKGSRYQIVYTDIKERTKSYREKQRQTMNARNASSRDIGAIPETVNTKRRGRCKADLALFFKTYMPETFYLPWSPDHIKIINKLQTSIIQGGLFAMAMPRSSGKSSLCEMAALFATLYGYRKYVVIIGASQTAANSMLDSIKVELDSNDLLLADFPKVCFPFQKLEGASLRAKGQSCEGERTHIEWTSKKIVFPTIKDSCSSGSVIEPKGLTGHLRGLKHKNLAGETVRPDQILIDDPMDDSSANSPQQCDTREKLINGAVLGLAGHKKKIAAVMPCTIIAKNDLADRILNHEKNPEWRGEVCKLIYQWPETQDTLWKEYAEIRTTGILEGDNGAAATEFYRNNRLAMDKGAIVAWNERKLESEISALQHAENLLLERGEKAFYAELQNDPVKAKGSMYNITSDMITTKLNHVDKMNVPEDCHFLTVGIDINLYALSWVVTGFRNDLTASIVDYGQTDEVWSSLNSKGVSEAQGIFNAIADLCYLLTMEKIYIKSGEQMPITGILVDCGYMTETVIRACKTLNKKLPVPIMPSRGAGARNYKPTKAIGPPGDNFHKKRWPSFKSNVIIHSSDYWRRYTQRAFILKPHAPGSISLYGKDANKHKTIAEHISAEKLIEYVSGDSTDFYNWSLIPGHRNDLLDALVISMVAGGLAGARATGGERSWRTKPANNIPQRKRTIGNSKTKGRASYG